MKKEDSLREYLEMDKNYLETRDNLKFNIISKKQTLVFKQVNLIKLMYINIIKTATTHSIAFMLGVIIVGSVSTLAATQIVGNEDIRPTTVINKIINTNSDGSFKTFKALNIQDLKKNNRSGVDVYITDGYFEIISINDNDFDVNSGVQDLTIKFPKYLISEEIYSSLKRGDVIKVTARFTNLISNPPYGYNKIDYILSELKFIKFIYTKTNSTEKPKPFQSIPYNTLTTFKDLDIQKLQKDQSLPRPEVYINGGTFEVSSIDEYNIYLNSGVESVKIFIPIEEIKKQTSIKLKPKDVIRTDVLFGHHMSNPAFNDFNLYYTNKRIDQIRYIYTKK